MVKLTIAGIQFTGRDNIQENLTYIIDKVKHVHEKGAKLVVLPEICNIVQKDKLALSKALNTPDNHTFIQTLQELAKTLKIWIHLGSMAVKTHKAKFANRAFLIDYTGTIVASYDKIHMFNANLKNNETYKESNSYEAGNTSVVHQTPFGGYGLSICYDIRFPHLFTKLAQKGALIIAVPACFTYTTGKEHWEVLCRARAIETGCFIIAIGHTGTHKDGRRTFGHSMVVDPWGNIVQSLKSKPDTIIATIDTDLVETARQHIPALKSIKPFA